MLTRKNGLGEGIDTRCPEGLGLPPHRLSGIALAKVLIQEAGTAISCFIW